MKRIFIFLVFLCSATAALAQDSIKIIYAQDPDTLVKQRFIDRYENVFMTKVPTRNMFKIGYVTSTIQGSGLSGTYEFKIGRSFSFEAGLYGQLSESNSGVSRLSFGGTGNINLWSNVKGRWYHDMNKRITEGLNANNFSGKYVGFSYEQSLVFFNRFPRPGNSIGRVGLEYGFQSRFFNNGYVDFAVGLYHQKGYTYGRDYAYDDKNWNYRNFVFATRATVGLAAGDWKRKSNLPVCEALICDEKVLGQWKVSLPDIKIGYWEQNAALGIAYERKVGHTPLSVQAGINGHFNRSVMDYSRYRSLSYNATGQARYYLFQKSMVRKGKGADNLTGLYAGLQGNFNQGIFTNSNSFLSGFPGKARESFSSWDAGLMVGYQQRLFGKVFIDTSIYYAKNSYFKRLEPLETTTFKAGLGFIF